MQIHVVQRGETLYSIAREYNSSASIIAASNEIEDPNQLVVGQALVIPIIGSLYWVVPGDSLYSIANSFNVNYLLLARINNISPDQPLLVGQRLYIPPRQRERIEVNAYVEPRGGVVTPQLEQDVRRVSPNLTYLAPFSFQIKRDGSLMSPPLNRFSQIAELNGAVLMMVVTNIEEGQFSAELGRLILTNEQLQDQLLNNIILTARRLRFKDIHFDMEFLPPENREDYNNFLRKASERLRAEGFLMSTALAPKTSATQEGAWYEAHDYKVHGEVSDFVVLMTYEWGYSAGPPLPVSPIGPVRDVVNYALTEIPSNKIMLGQNLYGYDWALPFIEGGEYARAISPQEAIRIAWDHNATILYDLNAQAPYFNYTSADGKSHIVWFEDARSIQAKFDLIRELSLRGISYWRLGLDFPQNRLLLNDNFYIIKR
jgi:spore germination protein